MVYLPGLVQLPLWMTGGGCLALKPTLIVSKSLGFKTAFMNPPKEATLK